MFNSNKLPTIKTCLNALIITATLFLYSCLPTSTPGSRVEGSNSTNPTGGANPSTPNYQEPTYPLDGIFIQEGSVRTNTNVSLPVTFTDSFLVRGQTLSQYLRTIPTTTKFCLVGKYSYDVGTERFLIMAAKPKTYTDLINKTTEYYLQVEPSNDAANQNDCLSYNLTNSLFNNATSPTAYFSLSQLCANCTTTVTSSGLKLFFVNGEEVPTVTVSSLILSLTGGSSSSGNACSESTLCKARGFDCCLQGQCVKDGAVRPGAMTMSGFASAQEDVRLNPDRFILYPQFYFVCESRPGTTTSGSGGGGSTQNPDYEARVRLMELKQLHDCINKVDGEFSHCTLKFTQANESIPGNFSSSASGHTDDINFSSINPNLNVGDFANNIYKIIYGGQTLYEQNVTPLTGGTFDAPNDNLSNAQSVNLTADLPANAPDANLYITYKVDGSCEKSGATLTKCTKSYIQGHSDVTSSMWHNNGKVFLLPEYADVSSGASLIVRVSGIVVPEDASTWTKFQSPNRIVFSNSYSIYQNQTIEITYFVTSGAAALTSLKLAAQNKVNSMCTCTGSAKCNLSPILDEDNSSVVNYECIYVTDTTTEPPANQTVYVSNKSIPHRYYDTNGVSYDENFENALPQEGTPFSYTNNDLLKPNNLNQYVGFNEINGSFSKTGTYIAKPAKMVRVKKDKQYDILVNSGVFSSCVSCGSDYYSSLQKIFPQNFAGKGGGYEPDNYASNRENNSSLYRPDDLLYGRACFVPATMIPWTHSVGATPRDQRRARLAAQHFLFANGYNRDWYGFDYGSLIGSFDGVSWFSIGNQRRIKATTGKLYLAVNSYVGDLNVDNNFNVTVSETTAFSSSIPDHDTETDGAQCQKSHYCSNDNDCFTQLGYDYTCQSVSSISTQWPQFDPNASEVVGTSLRTILSVVGGSNGQAKRCVYRGKGAPCEINLDLASSGQNFSKSSSVGAVMCSPNTSCVSLNTQNRFNDRIARFGKTPAAQNAAEVTTPLSDLVGHGARIILRPFDYYGTKSAPAFAKSVLNAHDVDAICIPGKDIASATDTFDLNARHPSNRIDSSDKLFGVGPAAASALTIRSLNACPATDAAGNNMQLFDLPLGDSVLNSFTISQNMSSNLLDLAPLRSQNIFSTLNGSQITSVGYQKNACLRAPGASCFSDMECAPSESIASKASTANLSSVLNEAEVKFWQEGLVCGNPDFKYLSAGIKNPDFDVKNNKCCREFGKTHTVYTQMDFSSAHRWCDNAGNTLVAGVNTNINSFTRYSRVHTAYDKMTCDRDELPGKPFALSLAADTPGERLKQILGQYKTLDTINERTCCTKHWVRNFASTNGGGHAFAKTKMQNIDKFMWRNVSWAEDDETSVMLPGGVPVNDAPFECDPDQYGNPSCEIKSLTPSEEEKYLTWAGTLELVGIPQVAIKSNDQIFKLVSDTQGPIAVGVPLTDTNNRNIISDVAVVGEDFSDISGTYYSAASYSKLNMESASKNNMKKVFSENEFNCCVPSGQEVTDSTTASQCCTGSLANNNGVKRCCLPDFTDITVYLNRYVSSEGRGLPDSAYDQQTGYIKDPGQVQLIAAQKNLCCSGNVMTGVAVSQLSIPLTNDTYLPPDMLTTSRRLNYRSDSVDNNPETGSIGALFDAGIRWNNHVYCVPAGLGQ